MGISTVAVLSDIERESMHVRLADEAVCIGPASSTYSYLNIPALLTAAELTDASAIHPGYGFLSENAHFAETCQSAGITFIGPTPENIRMGGDKSTAREILKKKGVPVIPGSEGVLKTEKEALDLAHEIGFPVILKAAHGGGGRGMKIVNSADELKHAFHMAQREAQTAFGIKDLYMEKYITSLRHLEVQIAADAEGNIIHLGERDCSVQRRHQKLIEESPSPAVSDKYRKKLGDMAIKTAKAFGYVNVGTVEFAVDENWNAYFMEINTRVQVEHPVTEAVTGVDLIKEQIRIAAGKPLEHKQAQISMFGHAIECRINAEDPVTFMPSPGKIQFYYQPGGPGVRVDTAAYGGWTVPSHYDSLIAKLIVRGENRAEAIDRMKRALDEFHIEGIKTTVSFHRKVMDHPIFIGGDYDTAFLDKFNPDRK
jgi:acetyl-CoA carboxylase biotin carboxylase subunit